MKTTRMLFVVVILALLAAPLLLSAQDRPAPIQMTLRLSSSNAAQPVSFKGAYRVDQSRGLQLIEGTTPFEVQGTSAWAIGVFEQVSGASELRAELLVGTESKATASVSGSGTIVVEFDPRRPRRSAKVDARN